MRVSADSSTEKKIDLSKMPLPLPGSSENAPLNATEIIDQMDAFHRHKMMICDELEAIADSLPFEIDPAQCMALARSLKATVSSIQAFEERYFFPLVARAGKLKGVMKTVRDVLEQNHREDEGFAEELAEALVDLGLCVSGRDAETTGYMLRGFFEGMRRHVALERHLLLEPLRAHLSHPPQ